MFLAFSTKHKKYKQLTFCRNAEFFWTNKVASNLLSFLASGYLWRKEPLLNTHIHNFSCRRIKSVKNTQEFCIFDLTSRIKKNKNNGKSSSFWSLLPNSFKTDPYELKVIPCLFGFRLINFRKNKSQVTVKENLKFNLVYK